jgi:hypothetical protein
MPYAGASTRPLSLDLDVAHREVLGVVGEEDRPVSSCRAGNESVRRVNRHSALLELSLIATGSGRGLPRRVQETQTAEEGSGCPSLSRPDSALDLGDVDAARPQRVSIGQQFEQEPRHRFIAA